MFASASVSGFLKASSERLSSCSKYRILVAGRSKFHIQPKFYKAKSFRCRHGNAYLFSKVVNVTLGEKEERLMLTGYHTVADIFCVSCGSIVGWKYEVAHDKSQKYKEGKFILERFKVSGPDGSNYWINHESQVGGSDADDA